MFPLLASQTRLLSLAAITVPNRLSLHFTLSHTNLTAEEEKKKGDRDILYILLRLLSKKHQPATDKSSLLTFVVRVERTVNG